jgi:hypothetical protein
VFGSHYFSVSSLLLLRFGASWFLKSVKQNQFRSRNLNWQEKQRRTGINSTESLLFMPQADSAVVDGNIAGQKILPGMGLSLTNKKKQRAFSLPVNKNPSAFSLSANEKPREEQYSRTLLRRSSEHVRDTSMGLFLSRIQIQDLRLSGLTFSFYHTYVVVSILFLTIRTSEPEARRRT